MSETQRLNEYGKDLQARVGFGEIGSPTKAWETFSSFLKNRMSGYVFWIMGGNNFLLILAMLTAVGLMLGYQVKSGLKLKGNSFDDPESLAFFIYALPLGGMGLVGVALVFLGKLLFSNFWSRAIIALGFGGANFLGVIFVIWAQVFTWGRLWNCQHTSAKHGVWCHDNEAPLIGTSVVIFFMGWFGFVNVLGSILVLIYKPVWMQAMGMTRAERKEEINKARRNVGQQMGMTQGGGVSSSYTLVAGQSDALMGTSSSINAPSPLTQSVAKRMVAGQQRQ